VHEDLPLEEKQLIGLLAAALRRLDEGGEMALEQFLQAHRQHADVLRSRLRRLHGVGLLVDSSEAGRTPERIGEFVLRERLGGGGMGLVYRAEQPSLKRDVALKLIRPENLFFPESRERFQREIEAIAQLEHPAIVRVYETGEEQGLPYFTMECVHGVSLTRVLEGMRVRSAKRKDDEALRDLLAQLRGDNSNAPALFEPQGKSWVEVCCRWARDLGSALAYAHARGVLHRDLKPSNIMLTWDGRVLLLDFGLASTRGSERITKSGAALGSLAYMAPEQLQDSSQVSERTDIYGLGVTLYELLALRHPFHEEGSAAEHTSRRILEGHPDPLRASQRSIPWDAETVCLAAMDRDPARRYEDASALVRDLDNVLHFRPIKARRPGPGLRLRRFTQRHPATSVGLMLGLLLLVGGPLGLWRAQVVKTRAVGAEQQKTEAALQTVQQQRNQILAKNQLAEERFDIALQAVADVLVRIGYIELRNVPNSAQIRHELLGIAEDSSQNLVRQIPDHLLAREIAARVHHFQGQLLLEERNFEQARPLLVSAVEVFAELWEADSTQGEIALQYALTLNLLGSLANLTQDVTVAEDHFYSAMDVFEQALEITDSGSTRIRIRREFISTLTNLATMLDRLPDSGDEPLDFFREALTLAEELVEDDPSLRNQDQLVVVLNNLASILDDPDESLALYQRASEIGRSVLRWAPQNRTYRYRQAVGLSNVGLMLHLQRTPQALAESSDTYSEAIRQLKLLSLDYPDQTEFARQHARALAGRAHLGVTAEEPPEELRELFQESLEALEPFCARGDCNAHHDRALARYALYEVLLDLELDHEARRLAEIAVRDTQAVRNHFPGQEARFDYVLSCFKNAGIETQ
jgi:serine/threonine protein kinase/tetratricopeptide (TPR) repeat protein